MQKLLWDVKCVSSAQLDTMKTSRVPRPDTLIATNSGQRKGRDDLAHPKRVRAIAAARIKTDRIDATILARLARTDLLPTSYAPPVEVRELREVVRHRAKLVRERTRHKNRIHCVLAQYNIHAPCSDLFGKQGRVFLMEARDRLSTTSQLLLEDYLYLIGILNERITALNQIIRAWGKNDPRAAPLMSMPGIANIAPR